MLGFVPGNAVVPSGSRSAYRGGICRLEAQRGRLRWTTPPRGPPQSERRQLVVCRIDRADEGFVTCGACGSDVLVAVSAFAQKAQVGVKCPECGRRWQASGGDVFTLDGTANIVSSRARLEAEEAKETEEVASRERPVKLYVAGLSPKVSTAALTTAFNEFGDVKDAVVVLDKVTGRSRGFAFVTMANTSCAEAAMSVLNDSTKLGGRPISVRLARD